MDANLLTRLALIIFLKYRHVFFVKLNYLKISLIRYTHTTTTLETNKENVKQRIRIRNVRRCQHHYGR